MFLALFELQLLRNRAYPFCANVFLWERLLINNLSLEFNLMNVTLHLAKSNDYINILGYLMKIIQILAYFAQLSMFVFIPMLTILIAHSCKSSAIVPTLLKVSFLHAGLYGS